MVIIFEIYVMENSVSKEVAAPTMMSTSQFKEFVPDEACLKKTIKIQQSVESDCGKKGPCVIVRSGDLNDGIAITRRYGEGLKPLFERDDIKVNTVPYHGNLEVEFKHKQERIPSITYRQVEKHSPRILQQCIKELKTSRSSKTVVDDHQISDLRCIVNTADEQRRKKPYFSDPAREKDRLRRLYGSSTRCRSRSRTPEHSGSRTTVRKHTLNYSSKRIRSTSRDNHRSHSPYRLSGRDNRDARTHRRSHSRSPTRDRIRHRSSLRSSRERDRDKAEHKKDRNDHATAVMTPSPYIPVPVAVADYSYSFLPWSGATPAPIWGPHPPQRPPPNPYYPVVPILPARMVPHQFTYGAQTSAMPYAPIPFAAYRPRPRYLTPRQNFNNFQHRYKKPPS